MTVQELIAILQTHPGDMRVIVDGYEGGFSDPTKPHIINISLDVEEHKDCWFYGPHNRAKADDPAPIKALLIPR